MRKKHTKRSGKSSLRRGENKKNSNNVSMRKNNKVKEIIIDQ